MTVGWTGVHFTPGKKPSTGEKSKKKGKKKQTTGIVFLLQGETGASKGEVPFCPGVPREELGGHQSGIATGDDKF